MQRLEATRQRQRRGCANQRPPAPRTPAIVGRVERIKRFLSRDFALEHRGEIAPDTIPVSINSLAQSLEQGHSRLERCRQRKNDRASQLDRVGPEQQGQQWFGRFRGGDFA
jgi:hypothetical protein